VIVSKPSSDRRSTGAMSVVELLIVKNFPCPTTELQELMSVEILNCEHAICDRNFSQLMKIISKDSILLA